jgi:hypothetical protein
LRSKLEEFGGQSTVKKIFPQKKGSSHLLILALSGG